MGTAGVLSFGTMNTAQNRFFWRGAYSAGTIYNPYDVVSYLGAAYIALTTQSGVLPTNTGSWDQMTSTGSVTSVAGRIGNVTLSSADLTDKDAVNGVAGLDANAFLKASEFNLTINAQTGTTYTFVAADRAKLVTFSNAAAVAAGLPQATGSFATGWYCEVENIGAGVVTITPTTSTIEGATSITLNQYESVTLVSSGGNYLCLRSKVRIASTTATTHQFVTAIASDGTATKAQPAFSDISGVIGAGQVTATAATAHQFLTAIASDGTATKAQPAFSDISGTVAATQLPTPTAATLGGVQSFAAQASKWINTISTAGVPSATQPAASDLSNGVSGSGAVVLATSPTLSSPVINGSPTGTGIPTVTLKKGSGSGTNYTSTSTTYVQVDGTNLALTVTIPTGWKLFVSASCRMGTSTANVFCTAAIADGGTVLVETGQQNVVAGNLTSTSLQWVINGNGASHTVDLRFKTSNASDAVTIGNSSSTDIPTMVFILTPSN